MILLSQIVNSHILALTENDLALWSLGTVTGIILVTMGAVEILKRVFQKNAGFGKIPVFVYAIVISVILVTLATFVFKNDSGTAMLPGPYWSNIWKAILGAGTASGLYTWINNPESVAKAQPLGDTNDRKKST